MASPYRQSSLYPEDYRGNPAVREGYIDGLKSAFGFGVGQQLPAMPAIPEATASVVDPMTGQPMSPQMLQQVTQGMDPIASAALWAQQYPNESMAGAKMAMSATPGVGIIPGAYDMAVNPSQRTLGNIGLELAGGAGDLAKVGMVGMAGMARNADSDVLAHIKETLSIRKPGTPTTKPTVDPAEDPLQYPIEKPEFPNATPYRDKKNKLAYKPSIAYLRPAPTSGRLKYGDKTPKMGDMETANARQVTYAPGPDMLPMQFLRPEDLLNRPWVTSMADTSRGNMERIVDIDGTPMNSIMYGGQNYMLQPYDGLWASERGAVGGMLNNARRAADLPGAQGSPLFLPYQMGPTSPDFATMTSDVMLNYGRKNMPAKVKRAFDKRVREGKFNDKGKLQAGTDYQPIEDWPGIDNVSPEYMAQLEGEPRKAVIKAMDEAYMTSPDSGALSYTDARSMITAPDQTAPSPGRFMNVGEIDLDAPIIQSYHPTYSHMLPGSYVGTFPGQNANLFDARPMVRSKPQAFDKKGNLTEEAYGDPEGNILFTDYRRDRRGDIVTPGNVSGEAQKAIQAGAFGLFTEEILEDMIRRGAFLMPD